MFGRINFGDLIKNRQFAILKSPQKFPAIRLMPAVHSPQCYYLDYLDKFGLICHTMVAPLLKM